MTFRVGWVTLKPHK